ncbi:MULTISPECIES: ABC transporter permease [unclassified Adlercreutzia]|uniref:ABC transporter permease n=1 Tax=unclassified Adlercreutzia TaxID=2636013 RepID=UPI0013EDCA42|nr:MULTISPECIES: ABC transporter permease [unclassified Adlercreutzia]
MALSEAKKNLLRRNWFTITSLVSRDFKLKYRRSALGVAWSVLNPLLMMCVLAAVFSMFLRFGDIPNFPLYLILGNTIFALMADSTSAAMYSVIESAPLIKKIRIDKIIFPLEKVLFQVVNFVISLIAVIIVMLVFRIAPTPSILLLPLLVIYVAVFSAGLSMALSALAVFFRDVLHLWSVVITAWTYATPLFYPITILPDLMQTAMMYNPMYHYVTYFRDIALYGTVPSLSANFICLGMALVSFAIGLAIFKKNESRFILYV